MTFSVSDISCNLLDTCKSWSPSLNRYFVATTILTWQQPTVVNSPDIVCWPDHYLYIQSKNDWKICPEYILKSFKLECQSKPQYNCLHPLSEISNSCTSTGQRNRHCKMASISFCNEELGASRRQHYTNTVHTRWNIQEDTPVLNQSIHIYLIKYLNYHRK